MTNLDPYRVYGDLLMAAPPDTTARLEILSDAGFADPPAADTRLARLAARTDARAAFSDLLPLLLSALGGAADPDRALGNFERFADCAGPQEDLFASLRVRPRGLGMLVTLFAGSQFLTEILLRRPAFWPELTRPVGIAHHKPRQVLYAEAQEAAALARDGSGQENGAGLAAALDALRGYQQRELLRIGMCDLNGLLDLSSVTAQLSHLADAMVQVCLERVAQHLRIDPSGFAVLAMGKLGGGELNYSSDIDLLFLARTASPAYDRLGTRLIQALTSATSQGFLYRVDMRLRPWGTVGPLVPTVGGHLAYLERHARLWEKQALLKARPVAGDESVGQAFLSAATPLLFHNEPEQVRFDVHAMKQRTEAQLRRQGRRWGEVKLGEGSIRDVEFVTQYLQLICGGEHADVRGGNTLQALGRLAALGLLPADEERVLADGYVFLRSVEHYLQILEYQQTHTLPETPGELAYLAQRLGFRGPDAGARFVQRFGEYSAAVRAVYLRHLGGDAMNTSAQTGSAAGLPAPDVSRHLARMSPSYAAAFTEGEIKRHAVLADRLDDEHPVQVETAELEDELWRVTIVGYDYLGELSLICGLLFVHGFSIVDGNVHTYEPQAASNGAPAARTADSRRKIVDVFTVRPVGEQLSPDTWTHYATDLNRMARRLALREQREVQGELAKRVAEALHEAPGTAPALYPVDIAIDNDASDRYTVLRIDAPDTAGFLYEFSNALALNGVYIAQVAVSSNFNRVRDILWVTDAQGRKISDPARQHELRAATALVKHFTHLLARSSNPELALMHFHEYLGELFRRPNWTEELASLGRPEVLGALARLLGVSDFLWDDFLRMQYANLFPVLRDVEQLTEARTCEQLEEGLAAALAAAHGPTAWRDALNAFKDREMFRVDMRYIQGHTADLEQFEAELSDLAEIVLAAAYEGCDRELRGRYGAPLQADGRPAALSLCALGKCGGREMGFASDVELMFVFSGNGKTDGSNSIPTPEYYERLVVEFSRAIRARHEGIFEVDLRLRPYGNAGSLAVSLDAFSRYFGPAGPAWSYERQALIKLRPIAGDADLGAQVVAQRDAIVYGGVTFDLAGMRAMRERQIRHLVTPGTFNAKFSRGGLVDLEYLVQGLQMTYGEAEPRLRVTKTVDALAALAATGRLTAAQHADLLAGYLFLRQLINALRMVRGNAKDLAVPPPESEEFAFLARRLGYGDDLARLRQDLLAHTTRVQELNTLLLA